MIKVGADLLLDGIPGELNEKQQRIVQTANNSIDRLSRIINDLLDISKIEAGKIDLNKRIFNLADLLKQIANDFEPRFKQKGLEIRVSLSSDKMDIFADSDRMIQVFTNFIGNALKFTEKGHCEISAKDRGQDFECVIRDTGVGISKEDFPKLFGKFMQFRRASGPGEKGTGLGLSIAKGIIEMHEGSVWAESELNVGTKFTFVIPKKDLKSLPMERLESEIKNAQREGSRMSIVLVSITDFDKLKSSLPRGQSDSILKGIKDVLAKSVRMQRGDAVIKDSGDVIVILKSCDNRAALSIKTRLQDVLSEYSEENKLTEQVRLKFGYATCPDDGSTEEKIISKAKERLK